MWKKFWAKIKGWLCGWKFWVVLVAIIIGTVLLGPVVAEFGGVILGWIAWLIGAISDALKWLAGLLNFFGWYGFV